MRISDQLVSNQDDFFRPSVVYSSEHLSYYASGNLLWCREAGEIDVRGLAMQAGAECRGSSGEEHALVSLLLRDARGRGPRKSSRLR
ncbi:MULTISPECIES: hypothetical protein [Streptomyces]|uniref:hypothetical protein n=1 Tax=Streptomyces TaxID=1883 RepID=UPI00386ED478